ncbi:GlxA family transcriptional regulator [Alteromonadaceae bacterium M269]|nr:GlxA family transcriptional regulator [Alteromonadaceae bacterium M269]
MPSCADNEYTIGILNYPGAQRAAVFGLADLFETANRMSAKESSEGDARTIQVKVIEDTSHQQAPLSTIILPPSLNDDTTLLDEDSLNDLAQLHQQGTLLCSVCAGAFVLAQTGILDGRKATTHWALAEKFRELYPDVKLDTDKLVIDDGDVITAGGLMAWTDLGLKLVDRYLGSSTMLATARFMLVDPGGREQRFYSVFSPSLTHGDEPILKVQHWLQTSYEQAITVNDMAEKANLSTRTFIRRFQQATELSPSTYLQHLRVGKARSLMESSKMTIDKIAWEVGYNDTSAFRKTFQKLMGLTPQEYRYRFTAD